VHLHNNCAIGSNITTCLHRFADDDIVRKTTLREVKILKMLKCPNIVSLLEAFRRKGKLYLVFEYVERNMLEVLEERPDGLDRESVRRYIFQLCLAIEYCHRNSVIHRDIKPENLLVSQSDRVLKLCDFGFARTVPKSGATDLTDYVATRWYRSPELLLGSTTYTAAVDVWAIGCLMGEMTDGQPLFPGDTEVDQLKLIQQGMGPLTSTQMELLLRNPNFRGMKFPDMCRAIDTLRRKYSKRLPAGALEFMRDCLRMDPKRRLSARQCVEHPWFDGLPAEFGWTPMVEPTEGAAKAASGGGRNFQPVSTRQADAVSAANSLAGFSVPHLSPTGMVMPVSRSPEAPEVPDTPGAQVGLLTGADTDAYGDGGFEPDDEDDE